MKYSYDFDTPVERRHTDCVKHDGMMPDFGSNDLTPMWVADMDFRSPDFIMEAIRNRCRHEVLGYTMPSDGYWEAVTQWLKRRYNIDTHRDNLHFIPGIVSGIAFVLQAFTKPGDKILVMSPVYPPFLHLPEGNGRELVTTPLSIEDGRFAIDFDDLDKKAEGCRLMILSNPHNPGGRVWSIEELRQIAKICSRHGVLVISDEIHADLTLPGHRHTAYATVSPEAREGSITFIAPSKTFNIAGLGSSIAYTPNKQLRQQLHHYLDSYEIANGNIFAFVGAEAAFRHGEEWLDQLTEYLSGNVDCLMHFIQERMPRVKAMRPEASFLAWLDFKAYGLSHSEVRARLITQAKVALNDGTNFGGDTYRCCFRMNLGCPRATLMQALEQIAQVFETNA